MGWYRVKGSTTSRTPSMRLVAGSLFALAMLIVSFRTFPTVRVTVNGVGVPLQAGASAESAVLAAEGRVPWGDVLGVVDRSVVQTGGGEPPRLTVNGTPASLETRVYDGDAIAVRRGRDVVESVVTTIVAVPIPVRVEGRGPLVQLASPGAMGLREQQVGAVSGQVVSQRTLRRPVPMVYRHVVPGGEKVVALTFDDGPWPDTTERILSVLRKEGVTATFFMVGSHVKRWPDIAAKVAEHGHLIGNHTETHRELGDASAEEAAREIRTAQRTIEDATGVRPHWFRPPGGERNRDVYRVAADQELRLALWNVDPLDWRKPPASVIENRIVEGCEPGSVVLLHDGGGDRRRTLWALQKTIRRLRERGYRFVTLDELPKIAGATR